jgi:hypothetical protein
MVVVLVEAVCELSGLVVPFDGSVYDSNGKSSMSMSSSLNVWACSPSFGAAGACDVAFRDAKENALGFDCCVFGSWNRDTCWRVIGVGVKLRIVRGGVAMVAVVASSETTDKPVFGDS